MSAAIALSSWNHILCFAHSLQLAVNDAKNNVEGMKNVCSKGSAIVSYYHRSIQASSKLEHLQRQMNKPVHKLIQAIETRWNSEYLMLERLLEQREPLSAELSSSAKLDRFSTSEWKLVSGYVQFLKPMYAATTEMSSESYPTISMVIPILYVITAVLNRLVSQSQSGVMFGKELVKSIKARFPNPKASEKEILMLMPDAKPAPLPSSSTASTSVCSIWDSFDQLSETHFLASDDIAVKDEIQIFLKEKTD
ncbi:hypothetical protein PR048_004837 [Dryococelus australis]|uniref:Transposase n=1 Tax=Dryococelus australis TaxID=614101 RepID=A0ABQ9I6J3_9NEOP|nr:hypothetical protein PR048_004837 [Dryococelus australis]